MSGRRIYQVGDHRFALELPENMLSEKGLQPYLPFQTDSYSGDSLLFTLTVTNNENSPHDVKNTEETLSGSDYNNPLLSGSDYNNSPFFSSDCTHPPFYIENTPQAVIEDEEIRMAIYQHPNDGLTVNIDALQDSDSWCIRISEDYSIARAYVQGVKEGVSRILDTALMLLYAFASSGHDTILIHASVIENDGKGYLFLGKSGTGKSTHSRLWLENVKGSRLLNDDNPVVRINGEEVHIYGSPWSGKTNCHIARRVSAGAPVRLTQAPFNRITPLKGIRAYAALLPSCSCMKWNHRMAEALHATLCKIIDMLPVYGLECLPDREAAELCHKVITGTDD